MQKSNWRRKETAQNVRQSNDWVSAECVLCIIKTMFDCVKCGMVDVLLLIFFSFCIWHAYVRRYSWVWRLTEMVDTGEHWTPSTRTSQSARITYSIFPLLIWHRIRGEQLARTTTEVAYAISPSLSMQPISALVRGGQVQLYFSKVLFSSCSNQHILSALCVCARVWVRWLRENESILVCVCGMVYCCSAQPPQASLLSLTMLCGCCCCWLLLLLT